MDGFAFSRLAEGQAQEQGGSCALYAVLCGALDVSVVCCLGGGLEGRVRGSQGWRCGRWIVFFDSVPCSAVQEPMMKDAKKEVVQLTLLCLCVCE